MKFQVYFIKILYLNNGGFTLFELMMALCLSSIVFYSSVQLTNKVKESINKSTAQISLFQDVRRAQATAVSEGCRGVFLIADDHKSYTFGCDYIPYSTLTVPATDKQFFLTRLPSGLTISYNKILVFNSKGQCIDTANVLSTTTVTLTDNSDGQTIDYVTGTIRPTGFFNY